MSSIEDREGQQRQPGTLRTIHAGHLQHSNYHRQYKSYTSLDKLWLHWYTINLGGPVLTFVLH